MKLFINLNNLYLDLRVKKCDDPQACCNSTIIGKVIRLIESYKYLQSFHLLMDNLVLTSSELSELQEKLSNVM